jgi:hypothetical protein
MTNEPMPIAFTILVGIATILCAVLIFVFRVRPDRLQQARDAGESEESITRQLATLRRVRIAGWVGVAFGAFWLIVAFIRR